MSQLDPRALALLSRITHYGLDTWQPGKSALLRLSTTQYSRVGARIIDNLMRNGYLVEPDATSEILTSIGGRYPIAPTEMTRFEIDGRWFQIDTDDWAVAADAQQIRGTVRSGLVHLHKSHPSRLALIHQRITMNRDDDVLAAILLASLCMIVAQYGQEFAVFEHHLGVRAFSSMTDAATPAITEGPSS